MIHVKNKFVLCRLLAIFVVVAEINSLSFLQAVTELPRRQGRDVKPTSFCIKAITVREILDHITVHSVPRRVSHARGFSISNEHCKICLNSSDIALDL